MLQVYDVRHSRTNTPLPRSHWAYLQFYRHDDTNETFLLIVGGKFVAHPDLDDYTKGQLNGEHNTILLVSISRKTWSVLRAGHTVSRRYGHDVVNIGNQFYIFGGRRHAPVSDDWTCPPDNVFKSYSILQVEYHAETQSLRGVWTTRDEPYPNDIRDKPLGYLLAATPIRVRTPSLNTSMILLTPGLPEDDTLVSAN
jgi:hypothetical protein